MIYQKMIGSFFNQTGVFAQHAVRNTPHCLHTHLAWLRTVPLAQETGIRGSNRPLLVLEMGILQIRSCFVHPTLKLMPCTTSLQCLSR